jgi:hypothetical protein
MNEFKRAKENKGPVNKLDTSDLSRTIVKLNQNKKYRLL